MVSDEAKSQPGVEWSGVERRGSLAADWQSLVERDKAALAKSLHDDTGGLLIAAVMDVTWAEAHVLSAPQESAQRLKRAHATLNVAIDLNRRIVEELRPTLLDNFGLIAALKWHFAGACHAAHIECEQHFPDPEPPFSNRTAIAFYRIAQTLLAVLVGHRARRVVMTIELEAENVRLTITGEGAQMPVTPRDDMTTDALASVQGRIRALRGETHYEHTAERVSLICQVPKGLALLTP